MDLTRRDLCTVMPAVFLPGLLSALAKDSKLQVTGELPSAVLTLENLPVHSSGGAEIRSVLKGKLATGELLEVHETTLPPGGAPHPPHHHVHSEMWLVREGNVELTIEGKIFQMGAGSAGFVHSNEEHGIKNTGTVAATYFVVAIGPGAVG